MYSVLCTLSSVLCTLYSLLSTLYSALCTLYSALLPLSYSHIPTLSHTPFAIPPYPRLRIPYLHTSIPSYPIPYLFLTPPLSLTLSDEVSFNYQLPWYPDRVGMCKEFISHLPEDVQEYLQSYLQVLMALISVISGTHFVYVTLNYCVLHSSKHCSLHCINAVLSQY